LYRTGEIPATISGYVVEQTGNRRSDSLIEIVAERTIRTSPETIWRHLTRVADWPRWYPGLHGVDTDQTITRTDMCWRAAGQMGRMLYRSNLTVTSYQMLREIALLGDRRPWLRSFSLAYRLERDGPNGRLHITIAATPGLGLPGRLLLSRTLRQRLQREADEMLERLSSYAERALPHH
jgi:hypothetical protein